MTRQTVKQPAVTLRPRGMGFRRWIMAILIIAAPVAGCGIGVSLVADGYSIRCHDLNPGIDLQLVNWTADTTFSLPIPVGQCPS